MENSLEAQLALLRKRIAKVDARYSAPEPVAAPHLDLGGTTIETPHGQHLEIERFYPCEYFHGSFRVERLLDLEPRRWTYLDTETTGLAGGAGTMAFLIGAAHVSEQGFHLRQWFVREHGEEASALHSLAEYLGGFETMVTYNGRSYDQPLLETRFTLARQRTPFSRLEHLDLLYGARRLWKVRYESCRLVELERQILGHQRIGDVPGEMIPQIYFDFLRTGHTGQLKPVLEHNALDILSLAFLAGIIPQTFEQPLETSLRNGLELSGIARWLAAQDRLEESRELFRRALRAGMAREHSALAMRDLARVEKRTEQWDAAVGLWEELVLDRTEWRLEALCELAKYHEHRSRNLAVALDYAHQLFGIEQSEEARVRLERIERKVARKPKTQLFPAG